ncbi:MAG: hypothetical protein COA78_11105 [Blastopirellula sp.]|nr:MAG: hypothetical protein COA78_11105 [Blastopirellula sp.]
MVSCPGKKRMRIENHKAISRSPSKVEVAGLATTTVAVATTATTTGTTMESDVLHIDNCGKLR